MSLVTDTDPGVDDALALIYASQRADIEAITTVAGNVSQAKTLRNMNYLKELLGIDADVFKGAEKPLSRELETAASHGESGLGEIEPGRRYEKSAGNAMEKLIEEADDRTDLLALGPLTNLAKGLEKQPDMLTRYRSVTIMGGAIEDYGNINRTSEFNFWVDPEAANKVINARGEKKLVPLDICRGTILQLQYLKELPEELGKIAKTYIDYYREKGRDGGVMYDPLAAGIALDDHLGQSENFDLRVETAGEVTRGMAVPEKRPGKAEPNCEVFTQVHSEKFLSRFKDSLKSCTYNSDKRPTK